MIARAVPVACSAKAKRLSWQFTATNDKSVEVQELLLDLHNTRVENKPSLSLLYIESSELHQEAKKAEMISKCCHNF